MDNTRFYRITLTVAGFLFLFLSILHCFQHLYFPLVPDSHGYTQDSVYLFNWSVALLLLFMSLVVLSIAKHRDSSLAQLKLVSAILVFTWSGRLLFEIIYPVTFRFLIFEQPTNIIRAGVFVFLSLLISPFFLENRKRNKGV